MDQTKMKKPVATSMILLAAWMTIPVSGQKSGGVQANPNARSIAMDRGTAALWRTLLELHTRASLILFTAHPDDEDGGMLAYESRDAGADTTLFTLNRGEGGQNVMSSAFWDQLGVLRTQELLAADRYYGVHQYWSRVADFGFTKTKEEALEKWGYDRVLYDSVRVVRMTRPLVVTSVFAGNVSDGHGQHQVAGQMAQEVYKAAADPNVFPDQIRAGLRAWAPLKVYVRLPFATITDKGVYDYATGHWAPARFRNYVTDSWIEGKPSATVEIPEGQLDPGAGLSYLQIARRGLDRQKSQNGGIGIPPPGQNFSPYHLYASRVATTQTEKTFFDGIDISLAGMANYAPAAQAKWIRNRLMSISSLTDQAMQTFSVDRPERIAPTLASELAQIDGLISEIQRGTLPEDARYNILHELGTKRRQCNTALVEALGLSIEADVAGNIQSEKMGFHGNSPDTFRAAIPGQSFHVKVHLANQGTEPVAVKVVRLRTTPDKDWTLSAEAAVPSELGGGEADDISFAVTVPADATITQPYFTRPNLEQPYYDILAPAYLNLSLMPYPLAAMARVSYRGADVVLSQVVQTTQRITGIGPVLNPLLISPAISIWVSPAAGIVPRSSRSLTLTALIHSNVKGPASGTVTLKLPAGWKSTPLAAPFATQRDGDEQSVQFVVTPGSIESRPYRITAAATYRGSIYRSGSTTVGYRGLRPYPYYRPASYLATGVDIRVPSGMKVGYITGTGDSVPESLGDLDIRPVFLSAQEIATGDLSSFTAIVLGVRAYAARPELKTYNARLLEYVKNGGTLIVQYNTPEFDHNYGPYPYRLSENPEKVIDENSKVILLDPSYPALNWPNKITVHDFDGWVEERGHGFMRTWDSRYVALTETHDPDQAPQKGGLLVASYGKGFYVYAGYAFYRQLPEGVPGAFRILDNLLSLSTNPGMRKLSAANSN